MENVYVMRKNVLAIFFVLALCSDVFSQTMATVFVRAGKHENIIRFVFESEDTFISKANVSTSGTKIIVGFPSAFNVIPQKEFSYETSIDDKTFTINFKESFDIKVFRLSSPPRLVLDVSPPKPKPTVTPDTPQNQTQTQTQPPVQQQTQPDVAPLRLQKPIVIDPGHGGYDSGLRGGDLKEKDIVFLISKEIEGTLSNNNKQVFLTRKSDQSMSLKERAILANQKMPEIFISIHLSASESFVLYRSRISNSSSDAVLDQYSIESRQKQYIVKSKELVDSITKALKEDFDFKVVQREISVPILNTIAAPAVFIELPSPKIITYDQKTRTKIAGTIAKGLSYYAK
jgi:N-acetylmuramoyl-L-alanine amidase